MSPTYVFYANNQSQRVNSTVSFIMARRVGRNVHAWPADINSRPVVCLELFRDMTHVLKCRAQVNTAKHTLN